MQALLSHSTGRKLRQGPFFSTLTDMHQSNIFVNSQWRVKCLVDLEWACSLPAEKSLRPPYWMTCQSVDNLTGENLDTFDKIYHGFMDIFEKEEKKKNELSPTPNSVCCSYRTNIMRKGWKLGNFWFFHALDSPKGMFNLFCDHIQTIFAPSHPSDSEYERIVSEYWAADTKEVIFAKLEDNEVYEGKLRQLFEDNASDEK